MLILPAQKHIDNKRSIHPPIPTASGLFPVSVHRHGHICTRGTRRALHGDSTEGKCVALCARSCRAVLLCTGQWEPGRSALLPAAPLSRGCTWFTDTRNHMESGRSRPQRPSPAPGCPADSWLMDPKKPCIVAAPWGQPSGQD